MRKKIWIVGAGYMAEEYLKVLVKKEASLLLVGNSHEKTAALAKKYEIEYLSGGFEKIDKSVEVPDCVILACSIDKLVAAASFYIKLGVKRILCEKPVSFSSVEIEKLLSLSGQYDAKVFVAYNRRYYSSVAVGKKLIEEDGGIESLIFDFTEWENHYAAEGNSDELSRNWLIANSSHVIDLAFYFMGKPKVHNILKVDKSARIFIGHGMSENGVPFSYHSNWLSAGRWGIEIMTSKRKIIYRPLEKVQVQMRNSLSADFLDTDAIDVEFKPGLAALVGAFVDFQDERLIPLKDHLENFKTYTAIQGNS